MSPKVVGFSCRAHVLPLARPWGLDRGALRLLVTQVRADDGSTGTGFSWTPTVGAHALRALLAHDLTTLVEGGPIEPEVVWDRLWAALHEGGGGGLTTMALAGVDIALWDLRAKRAGLALVDLLGRRRDAVQVYGSGVNRHYPLDELREQARRWVAAGHLAVKMKVGLPDLDEDVERVAVVREVIGAGRALMLDANQRWDLLRARRALRALRRFDPYWIEEPLLADDLAAHVELRRAIDVPVALGENVYTVQRFRELLVAGACDVVQPNVVRVGGITPFLRIAELARAFTVPVFPHLLIDLSGQLALCLPMAAMVEDVEDASFAAQGALAAPSGVEVVGGELRADTGPGHGLVFREDLEPL
jgi:L-alanine-DL-glutamate epimerase-like enolase superfamily enzyme